MFRRRQSSFRALGAGLRLANRVVAAAVLVFAAQIFLGAVLARPLVAAARGLAAHEWLAVVLAPVLHDLPKALCLLGVAYPLGRVTAQRPVATGLGLVLTVYLLDFGLSYAFGTHALLWLQWQVALGRGVVLGVVTAATVWLVARGRRAALEADRSGATCKPEGAPGVPGEEP